jgi:uncharacterized protein (DUF302 family)
MNRKIGCAMQKQLVLILMLLPMMLDAGQSSVFSASVKKPMNEVYGQVYSALEEQGFYVVFEANIGKNLAGFADKWGADYNRNKLDGIRSLVFCNGWYANQVSNLDPEMLALCPLHITLIEKTGTTTALFVRPSVVATGSPAQAVLLQVEEKIIKAVQLAMPTPPTP